MNYIRHLTGFFERVCKDHRLNPTHISVYMAIFQFWNINRFKNPISISRSEIMELSKVSAKNTYHKCVKDLHQYGYLRYDPSHHPLRGSWVYLFEFDTTGVSNQYKIEAGRSQVLNQQEAGSDATCDTGVNQAENMLSSESLACGGTQSPINISKLNKLNKHNKLSFFEKNEKKFEEVGLEEEAGEKRNIFPGSKKAKLKEIASAQKNHPAVFSPISEKTGIDQDNAKGKPAGLDVVIQFFLASGYPQPQALKFFHYNSATGWKVGGKAPIENWQSAAHSWMLNPQNNDTYGSRQKIDRQEPRRDRLNSEPGKDYSEPL